MFSLKSGLFWKLQQHAEVYVQNCLDQAFLISPPSTIKPDFLHWQGEVCFLSEELVSELLIAIFLTSTILALGHKTPILGFPVLPLSLAELCPVRWPAGPAGTLLLHLSTGPQDFHTSSHPILHSFHDASVCLSPIQQGSVFLSQSCS